MAFSDKQTHNAQNQQSGTHIPRVPSECDVAGCGCDTQINFVMVKGYSGKVEVGAFSDFGRVQGHDKILRSGYDFIRFITRCSNCYQNDLINAGEVSGTISNSHMRVKQESIL